MVMPVRRLAIDWEAFELAFTWPAEEGGCWLDLTTGDVVRWMGTDDELVSSDDIDAGLAEGRLVSIEPVSSDLSYDWMAEFADSVARASLQRELRAALGRNRPFRHFKDVLADHPVEREQWFAFETDRVRAHARAWLEENGIEPTNESPKKGRL